MAAAHILLVDDEELVRSSVKIGLETLGHRVTTCATGEEYEQRIVTEAADLVLMDIHLGDRDGLQLLEYTRAIGITTPMIMVTGYGDVPMAVKAMKLGAEDFLLKPASLEQLEVAIAKTLGAARMREELERLRAQVQELEGDRRILGDSAPIRRALGLAATFAASDDTTVLITGESGTGKELFAHYLHEHSPRAAQPFIIVDCGSIPKDLAESELFGYERGAFTGATERVRKGRFELAQHGTIFLDEIGELPLELQVKLLRVLESHRFYRLGGSAVVETDVRVLAATNRDLAREVDTGRFRQDLFYRLNVAAILLPPLRERTEDIALIAEASIAECNRRFRKSVKGLSPEALAALEAHAWPGNVRELRNVLERIMLVDAHELISGESVRAVLGVAAHNGIVPGASPRRYRLEIPPHGVPVNDVLRDLILQTLNLTGNNQVQAARVLGMTRAKFRYRLTQLGIDPRRV